MVRDFLEGQNQLLFTYGATSAGKTYTIQGVPGDSGIMPRAVDVIFNTVGDRISPQLPLQVFYHHCRESCPHAQFVPKMAKLFLKRVPTPHPGSLKKTPCSSTSFLTLSVYHEYVILGPKTLNTLLSTINYHFQPLGFNRVLAIGPSELESLAKEKDAMYKLGLELRANTGRISPDISTLSGVSAASTASTASLNSLSSSDALLDLGRLSQLFPGLATRDRDDTKLEIRHSNISYSVWISFAEIYNENIHDLFRKVPMNKKKRPTMKLCEDRSGNTYVKGLREVRVNSADEAYQALMIGRENLHFAATKLNQQSSRSHCIFTIKLVKVADPSMPHLARVSMLSFCDLAGSERISKTHNVGERLKEAGNINTSLLVLGRCIKSIRHNQGLKEKNKKEDQVVPFRESKLTRLFKSFFTGLGRSSLIVCISQAQYLFDESVHVCKFASIASKVTVETVKEAPPPKKQKRASRFSTMVAGRSRMMSLGCNSTVVGQTTMAWEPRKSSLLPAFSSFAPNARSTMVPLPLLDEGDDTVEEVEPLEETVVQTQYESLLALVEDLKKKLIEERKKNTVLERDLRSELCEEFNAMLVEVEGNWEARLREEKEEAERLAEWRLGELQKVHVNKNKRKRGDDDDDDMGVELDAFRMEQRVEAAEKEKVNLEEEVKEGRKQMQAMKDTTLRSKEVQDQLQAANSKLQFEVAESKRIAADREKEVTKLKSLLEEREKGGDVSEAVDSLKQELKRKDEEVSDLRQLLDEASVEFLEKEDEVKKMETEVALSEKLVTNLQFSLNDLQSQLEESHLMLGGANDRLEEKDARLEEVEADLEAGQNKVGI